jgi:tRNA pseudouridine55 synthase
VSETRAKSSAVNGFVVIDKPMGMTSQQVVSRVKRILGVRKAGHAGTLDPMATGVLVVGIGHATRLLGYIAGKGKQYEATIRLGSSTTTDDAEGEPLGEVVDATGLSSDAVATAMCAYVGTIEQVPSSVSAIKVDGRRAYDMVRAGQEVRLKARTVNVTRFDVLDVHQDGAFLDLDVIVDCSTGTYIRALARDVGQDLGVGGHLTALRRTRVGAFDVHEAVTLDLLGPGNVLETTHVASQVFPTVEVDEAMAVDISHGKAIRVPLSGDPTAILGPDGRLLALYRPDADLARPVAVFMGGGYE